MNPLTGGCHYSLGCDRFEKNCGACPLLGSTSENDLSTQIQRRKRVAISACAAETTRIVVTSRWLKRQAQRSELLGKFPIERIPYGLDTGVFSPRPRAVAREVFDLPQNDKIILFVSDSITNYRKGFDLLIPVFNALSESMPITLVAIGDGFIREPSQRIVELGRIDNERILSFAYSAADVFVTPARAEAFGQVVFEAMACGTPVVAFDTGGMPDMVRPGITGVLAPVGNALALGEAIKTLLKDDQLRQRMSAQCRMIAVDEYSLDVQAARYASLYEALIEASDRSRRTSPTSTHMVASTDALPNAR
jgi:glycosyltransferase involved in cell wall biosynthesis